MFGVLLKSKHERLRSKSGMCRARNMERKKRDVLNEKKKMQSKGHPLIYLCLSVSRLLHTCINGHLLIPVMKLFNSFSTMTAGTQVSELAESSIGELQYRVLLPTTLL